MMENISLYCHLCIIYTYKQVYAISLVGKLQTDPLYTRSNNTDSFQIILKNNMFQ